MEQFQSMSKFHVYVELKAKEDPQFTKLFIVDFKALEYIGNDLSKLLPNPVELIVFRITPFEKRNKQEFWTTKVQFTELVRA